MKILFIGNSYTYFNDLPKRLQDLASCSGISATVHSATRGGRHLYKNLLPDECTAELDALLKENEYDVTVLQEQSFFALVDYEKFEESVGALKEKINAGRTVLYATWGRKEGAELLSEHGWTSQGMTAALYEAYLKAAKKHDTELTPVGLCFERVRELCPDIELYTKDLSHPSVLGTSLAAIAHYKVIFKELPKDYSSLGIDDATLLVFKKSITEIIG